MGSEYDDRECERLRQVALASLGLKAQHKGPVKRPTTKPINKVVPQKPQHRPTPMNKNLIEIQTTSNILDDPDLVDEILLAEGLDISDSDCDEVVEEVICSEDESEDEDKNNDSSASPSSSSSPQKNSATTENNTSEQTEKDKDASEVPQQEDTESSPDEDALSVCSKYSLFDDEQDDLPPSRLPLRVRAPPQTTNNDDKVDHHSSSRSNYQGERRRGRGSTRSRSRSPRFYTRKDNNMRRRRTRSRSPLRRRPITRRSRSRDRDFRNRRTLSRDRSSRINNDHKIREKSRRREEGRRPGGGRSYSRSPPPKSSRRNHYGAVPSRHRSRTNSRDKSRLLNKRSSVSDHSSSESHNKSPQLAEFRSSIPSGVDQEIFEKRRRKFQDQGPVDKLEGKKIRLHSKVTELEESKAIEHERPRKEHESNAEVQKSKVVVLKPRKRNEESENEKRHDRVVINKDKCKSHEDREVSRERTIIRRIETSPKEGEREEKYVSKISEEVGDDQEDLRAKLIKRKLRTQGIGQLAGSGRIFTEALKGTRLLSTIGSTSKEKDNNEKNSSSNSKRSKDAYQDSSSSSSRKSVKRKVRLLS